MATNRKQTIAAAMWTAMEELRREEQDAYSRAYDAATAIANMAEAWDRLDLGPLPDPEFLADKSGVHPPQFDEEVGMTERIREILKMAGCGLSPTMVRDALVRSGFSLEGRSNPMAEIHTVLKRLTEKNRRILAEEHNGIIYYSFDTEVPPTKQRAKQ